ESVRRLLKVKFELGLFENPYVDEAVVDDVVGTEEFMEKGREAQTRAMVVLESGRPSAPNLPIRRGASVYSEQISEDALSAAGLRATSQPEDADAIIVRTGAPFEPRDQYMLEASFRA